MLVRHSVDASPMDCFELLVLGEPDVYDMYFHEKTVEDLCKASQKEQMQI